MSDKLNMSLDEIITKGITANGTQRRRAFIDKTDSEKRFKGNNNNNNKTEFNEHEKQKFNSLKRKEMDDSNGNNLNRMNNKRNESFKSNKCGAIFARNLKYEVSDEDIKQLFGTFGVLKRAAVNYLSDGRSAGTALIVFERKCDAITALESIQNFVLDGRALRLSLVEFNGFHSTDQKMAPTMNRSSNNLGNHLNVKQIPNSSVGSRSGNHESGSKENINNVNILDSDLNEYIVKHKITKAKKY